MKLSMSKQTIRRIKTEALVCHYTTPFRVVTQSLLGWQQNLCLWLSYASSIHRQSMRIHSYSSHDTHFLGHALVWHAFGTRHTLRKKCTFIIKKITYRLYSKSSKFHHQSDTNKRCNVTHHHTEGATIAYSWRLETRNQQTSTNGSAINHACFSPIVPAIQEIDS